MGRSGSRRRAIARGSFAPQIVPKGKRRFAGFDEKIIALYARGMSVRDIQAHLTELYGVAVGHDLISRVTDAVIEDVRAWQQRPLEDVYGYDLVAYGRADAVIVIAADTLTDTVIAGYRALGLGIGLAEAGVALVLESESGARARGALAYGALCGYGVASDAGPLGQVSSDGRGLERAMRTAVERSCLEPADIGAVWASRAGHRRSDRGEAAAIARLLGSRIDVVAPKLALGEPMGAGGALAAAMALAAWRRTPATAPLLVNSCSLGGTHVSLVLAPPSPAAREPTR